MKHTYTGKSLLELLEQYGTGAKGFYPQEWYKDEAFAKEKPPKGVYEINLGEDLVNLTFEEQKKKLKKGLTPIHPAILAEAILSHYAKTGERLLETKWSRTEFVDSDGDRVSLGGFDAKGLDVYYWWDDSRFSHIGFSSARKFKGKLDSGDLESFEILEIEINGRKYRRVD